MVSDEILNEIKNKETLALNVPNKSKLYFKLSEIVKSHSLVLVSKLNKNGSFISNNYYSQICITIYDKEGKSVFLKDEPNMSLEVFSDIVIQKKKKFNILDINNDFDFWEGIEFLINSILIGNYYSL